MTQPGRSYPNERFHLDPLLELASDFALLAMRLRCRQGSVGHSASQRDLLLSFRDGVRRRQVFLFERLAFVALGGSRRSLSLRGWPRTCESLAVKRMARRASSGHERRLKAGGLLVTSYSHQLGADEFISNSLTIFSQSSWRPLAFCMESGRLSTYFSRETKSSLPASTEAPMPVSQEA